MNKDELIEFLRENMKIKNEYRCDGMKVWYETQLLIGDVVISASQLPVLTPDQ